MRKVADIIIRRRGAHWPVWEFLYRIKTKRESKPINISVLSLR